jgi:predicted kinase
MAAPQQNDDDDTGWTSSYQDRRKEAKKHRTVLPPPSEEEKQPTKGRLVILRGLPGSGKTYMASKMAFDEPGVTVCSADHYFLGKKFTPTELGKAHEQCIRKAFGAMKATSPTVVIDNTNVECWEAQAYVRMAQALNYHIEIREPSTEWRFDPVQLAKRNRHGVPQTTIEHMRTRWAKEFTVDNILAAGVPPRGRDSLHVAQGLIDEMS